MNKIQKIFAFCVLPIAIVILTILIVNSIMQPVNFNKEKAYRESIAIQRLKDIRTLENFYKAANGKFTANADTLKDFYENGQMAVVLQIGSKDDSLSMAHTEKVKAANKRITGQELYKLYLAGDKHLVFSIESKIPVRDTLFKNRKDFCVDSLKYIPFSGGMIIEMQEVVKTVSGVQVPLFEAKIPYRALLKGLNNQLRINLDAEQRNKNRYEGLQVGSIEAPNNNAGNWE